MVAFLVKNTKFSGQCKCCALQLQVLETKVDLGRWWRFVVLRDPTVRMFHVRDLDMYMLPREVDAMDMWEGGNGNYTTQRKQFYVMRDTQREGVGSTHRENMRR